MERWQRIGEDKSAKFGKRSIAFAFPGGRYRICIDDDEQNRVRVRYVAEEEYWPIEIRAVCDGLFRLSGVAYNTGGLLGGTFWYELLLAVPSTITYWGDCVIAREDKEA
ncbi:hypothetical protein GCM10009416_41070 [Craurococcus roseus]|uniref:Uncharacterized protein n=1 Tax=Craurococcus roseus TaxID=77585 RepID=A0ABN1FW78_9PROT